MTETDKPFSFESYPPVEPSVFNAWFNDSTKEKPTQRSASKDMIQLRDGAE
jgi:hypothetical protein